MVEKAQDAKSEHSISGTSYGEPASTSTSPSRREIFDSTLAGGRDRVLLPRLRSDQPPSKAYRRPAHSLNEFRRQEGDQREARLKEVWQRFTEARNGEGKEGTASARPPSQAASVVGTDASLFTREKAERLRDIYDDELLHKCGNGHRLTSTHGPKPLIPWKDFHRYAEAKEVELWHVFHDELDLDGNGHLDAGELGLALHKAGIPLSPGTLSEFMTTLTSSPHSHAISFREFRDFLLLLPRKASTAEIYQYYEMRRYLGDDGRGPARVTMEGDVSLSAEDKPPSNTTSPTPVAPMTATQVTLPPLPVDHSYPQQTEEEEEEEFDIYEEEEHHNWLGGSTAVKYLLAGGVAGAVSRTFTAPFDRLRIFLITRQPTPSIALVSRSFGMKAITNAITNIYVENGILGFWIGNGLSVIKILPESAIKFLSYESSKRMFATYWDYVEDTRDISGFSRFMSGGIGGITSQLSIYPIETVKTQMMSSIGGQRRTLVEAVKHVHSLGGLRAYYRGLAIGLIGVFPYSAIDMSTFEALKLAYLRSTGQEEPGVMALLAFGSVSGSVGATSVYPLNLVRTRLQASGSPAHPQRYAGIWDVVSKTYSQSGVRGFYIGLGPTLAKVIPAVSISYMVYEQSKRK
ncbi:mitochondrial carrier [Thelephora terrestris]|uniref:Mitochondrial carrier n=1 Tax=Thelephora terrestris TaxID=56493 RepID=A0A9P6H5U6_9AGAM|nr:mitochondrial carrier [Thelephora terrestris]